MIKRFLFDTVQSVALALGIFATVYLFLLQPHEVRGRSMEPNFTDGEYLLTDKLSYKIDTPKRGDVIVFAAPPSREEDFIKRIIAVPGDTVWVENGKVHINDRELTEGYLPATTMTFEGPILGESEKVTLAADEYFVLGDNRSHSQDSRYFGIIKKGDILGKAWLVYWPPKQFGFVRRITYAGM
ncbi:signal peptidase I [Candidatus Microgenomates bacterium]|nr:signal peptidase I [Candidatus Microgenomates bacterium]